MNSTDSLDVLVWHLHGSWLTSLVQGRHRYLIPTLPEGGPWGRGRCGRGWPDTAVEVDPAELADRPIDVVVVQRPEELELAQRWTRRRPGVDVPAVYVEHNTPRSDPVATVHPMAGTGIPVVHVTHFNDLMWDTGDCETTVVPHGIVDPGLRYTGEIPHAAVLINEPVRRNRITGTDLLPRFADVAPVDVYGIGVEDLHTAMPGSRIRGIADLPQDELHSCMARRRVYVHTARWTSLGLSLIEAMQLGMPVVGLATTEAISAVPPTAGVLSTDVDELVAAVRRFVQDPELAASTGKRAREHATAAFGLDGFLHRMDEVLLRAAGGSR